MKSENPVSRMLSWYFSSPAGLVLTLVCFSGLLAGVFIAGVPLLSGLVLAGIIWLGGGILSLRSPFGTRAVREGLDRESGEAKRVHLLKVGEVITSLSCLRLADEDVRKAIQHVHFRGGLYRDAASDADTFVPGALYCLESALSACQAYMTELNEDAIERRFETPDDDASDAKSKVIVLLTSYARELERLTGDLGSLTGVDQLAIQKEIDNP